jgi:hypothetical protein
MVLRICYAATLTMRAADATRYSSSWPDSRFMAEVSRAGLQSAPMSSRHAVAALAVMLGASLGSFAHAHHGHFYDECARVEIEGRVERVEFKNPHNLFVLRLDDGAAYAIDWVNVTWLTKGGIIGAAKEAVVPGARVAVTGYRIKDAAELRKIVRRFKGDVNPNTVDARALRRVDGSFNWPIPASPRAIAPNCDAK